MLHDLTVIFAAGLPQDVVAAGAGLSRFLAPVYMVMVVQGVLLMIYTAIMAKGMWRDVEKDMEE